MSEEERQALQNTLKKKRKIKYGIEQARQERLRKVSDEDLSKKVRRYAVLIVVIGCLCFVSYWSHVAGNDLYFGGEYAGIDGVVWLISGFALGIAIWRDQRRKKKNQGYREEAREYSNQLRVLQQEIEALEQDLRGG